MLDPPQLQRLAPLSLMPPQLRGSTSPAVSAGFVTLYHFHFGFFWVLQKENFWEMLTSFSEPREMIWLRPGEPRKTYFSGTRVNKLSLKRARVGLLSFGGHVVSGTTYLCCYGTKAAPDNL